MCSGSEAGSSSPSLPLDFQLTLSRTYARGGGASLEGGDEGGFRGKLGLRGVWRLGFGV